MPRLDLTSDCVALDEAAVGKGTTFPVKIIQEGWGSSGYYPKATLARDPAARNGLEVVLCYPGVWAVWNHRVAHRLWRWRRAMKKKGPTNSSFSILPPAMHNAISSSTWSDAPPR